VKLKTRIGAAALCVLAGALVAAGCGSDSSDGGTASGKALDLVPKSAIGYATIDLDFGSDSWTQFNMLAGAFDPNFDIEKAVAGRAGKDTDFDKDIKPWLGDSAGAAITKLDLDAALQAKKLAAGSTGFSWIELKDHAKFETFLKDKGYTKDGTAGDFDVWKDAKAKRFIGTTDELAISAQTKAKLDEVTDYDGDTIDDADLDGVTGKLGDDSVMRVIVNGDAVHDAVAASNTGKSFGGGKGLEKFEGAAMELTPEDNGFHAHMFSKGLTSKDSGDASSDLFESLPGDTVLSIGGHDFGSTLQTTLGAVAKNPTYGGTATQFMALLGIDAKQVGTAFSGDFAVGLSGTDAGLGAVVGAVAGAFVQKSLKGINPVALAKGAALTLAFEKGDETSETLDKLGVGASRLLRAPAPKVGKVGVFQTKSTAVLGMPLTVASSEDIAALSLGTDVFGKWGSPKLGDNATLKAAWDAADAPDDAAGSFWFDYPRIAKIMERKSADGVTPGGWVGWGSHEGDTTNLDVFMHVATS
jgi:hypothetical protein